jgi:putative membrane protein
MPGDFFGPDPYVAGPAPVWTMLLLSGLSLLLWSAVAGLLVWAALRFLRPPQPAHLAEPMLEPPELSAVELLRLRYVLGEIDAATFEQMLERVLASQVREDPWQSVAS